MRSSRRFAALVIAVGLTLSLSSCWSAFAWGETSPEIDASSVTGTWSADGPDGQVATIQLRADGTAHVSGLPTAVADVFATTIDWSETFDGEANWSIRRQVDGEVWSVSVYGNFAFGMLSVGDDDGQHLVTYVGDPDSRVRIFFDLEP